MKKKNIPYMVKIICLICITTCMTLPANAQQSFTKEVKQRINPALNEFSFKLDCYEDDDEMAYTRTITVTDTQTGKVLQTLKTADHNDGDDAQNSSRDAVELIVEDLNFDSYADIRINSSIMAGANHTEICWLWNTKKNKFEYNATLSEICNLEILPDEQALRAFITSGAGYNIEQTYKYINGKPTLVKSIDQQYLDDGETIEETVRELKNGKLVETSKTVKEISDDLDE